MLNHGVSGIKDFGTHSSSSSMQQSTATSYFTQQTLDVSNPDQIAQVNVGEGSLITTESHLHLTRASVLLLWKEIKHSDIFLPACYLLLVMVLTTAGVLTYKQFANITVINFKVISPIIFIFLWAAIVAGTLMLLNILKGWCTQQRYAPLKPVALQSWSQLDELKGFVERLEKICHATEKPACNTLMKYLDQYYEKSVNFNKELQKIRLFLDDRQFDQLLEHYNATSRELREKLGDTIEFLSGQPYEQALCTELLEEITPLREQIDHYHGLISEQLVQIIRY